MAHVMPPSPFRRHGKRKLPMPVRLSAMAGVSLVLWGAILIPFIA